MTDKLKCPFCWQKLECCGTYVDGTKKLWCDNCELFGDNRLFEELIRTRKALDVAKEALNDIQFTDDGNQIVDIRSFAHHAFDQIKTALEQKEQE